MSASLKVELYACPFKDEGVRVCRLPFADVALVVPGIDLVQRSATFAAHLFLYLIKSNKYHYKSEGYNDSNKEVPRSKEKGLC